MSQYSTVVHVLRCDICENDSVEDLGENKYAKDMRSWARGMGWGHHQNKDYCPKCEEEYKSSNIQRNYVK